MCEPFFLKLTQLKQFLKALKGQAAYRYPVICLQDLFESGSLISRVIGKFSNAFLSSRRYADFSVAFNLHKVLRGQNESPCTAVIAKAGFGVHVAA